MQVRLFFRLGLFVTTCFVALAVYGGTGWAGSDATRYALCDLRVLYLYDDPAKIDWPTLYYLNDRNGCRIDLATISAGLSFGASRRKISGVQMVASKFTVVAGSANRFDSVYARLWPDRRPDIVLIGDLDSAGLTSRFAAVTMALKPKAGSLFNIARIGRAEFDPATKAVTLNAEEVYAEFRDRIERETPLLMGQEYAVAPPAGVLSRYQMDNRTGRGGSDFVSGLRLIRLAAAIDSLVPQGGIREALSRKAGNYVSLMEIAQSQTGKPRLESVVNAYEELSALRDAAELEPSLARMPEIGPYLNELTERARQVAVGETGLRWDGRIVVHDSPYGPKVKFVSNINVAGPATVMISRVLFHPYWDSTAVVLDSTRQTISPHQSYVREYLIDIDSRKLESQRADSLRFTVELEAGRIPLILGNSLAVWSASRVAVKFDPPFYFVQPFAALEVDRVVTSMALNVVIEKPLAFAGKARINLETPAGVFAGAYRQDVVLEKGEGLETIRIPFSISKLFELGVHNMIVSLSIDNRTIDTDTGLIRIAGCSVPDTVSIGLLPDTSGYLEDILRMTNSRWQALTNRTLEIGELSAYDVLLIGSGALRSFPSFRKVGARIEAFIKAGGTLVVMPQPMDWPSEVLPVSLAPVQVKITGSAIAVVDGSHDLLKRPNTINASGLSAWFERPTTVMAAVVAPARPVLAGPGGEMLLSVSPLGRGNIVYCGLPLVDMTGTLNIEAIHLFANILNY